MPSGNRELIKRGAKPLALQDVSANLAEWFEHSARPTEVRVSVVRESPAVYPVADLIAQPTQHADLFVQVWPLIAGYLDEPRTESEVATAFGLHKAQAKAWLFDPLRRRVEAVLYVDSTERHFFTETRQELILNAALGIAVFIGKRYS